MSEERDYEAEARASGWVTQDAWKGAPDRWVDAKTFVERGEQFFPFVQAKLKKSLDQIETLRTEVTELREGNKQFREFHDTAMAREKKAREELISELEAERRKAITDGDGEAFDRADRKLQEARREPERKSNGGPSPEVQAWMADNAWYSSDPVLQSFADSLSDHVRRENPGLTGRAFLDKLSERVKAEMPHKFSTSRRDTSTTEDHQRKAPSQKAKTYENLPADARAACDRFVKTIPGFTKEQYLSQYIWSE